MEVETICRILVPTILVPTAAVSMYFRKKADRVGGRVPISLDGPGFRVPAMVIALTAAMLTVGFLIHPAWIAWSQFPLPDWVRLLGGPLGWACVVWILWMFMHLGPNVTNTAQTRSEHRLVTSGPYRLVRHPLYTGGLALGVSYTLLMASWVMAGLTVATCCVLAIRTRQEEANLIARFGDDYRSYRERTGKYVPRLW